MESLKLIPLSQLHPHPHNPRGPVDPLSVEELADSIREKGILQPLLVVPNEGSYLTVAGHRRHCAALLAGLVEAPCIVRNDLTDVQQEELMLIENLQRKDLSPLQEAKAFNRLVRQGYTRADIARNTGVNQARVQTSLQILKLTEAVQVLFVDFQMPTTAVSPLARIADPERQARLANLILKRTLTVPKQEKMVAEMEQKGDNSVNPGKPKQTRQRRELPVKEGYGRVEAVRDLEERNGQSLKFSDVLSALDNVCHKCGMGDMPTICSACPLPQFLHNLTRETVNENSPS